MLCEPNSNNAIPREGKQLTEHAEKGTNAPKTKDKQKLERERMNVFAIKAVHIYEIEEGQPINLEKNKNKKP